MLLVLSFLSDSSIDKLGWSAVEQGSQKTTYTFLFACERQEPLQIEDI